MMAGHLTIDRWIAGHARFSPDKPAINFQGNTLTYREMHRRVEQFANALTAEHHVKRGDRIALLSLNRPETFLLIFACAKLGAMLVPLNWRLSQSELAYVLEDCSPKLLLADSQHKKLAAYLASDNSAFESMPVETFGTDLSNETSDPATSFGAEITDPLLIVYTSGTTGRPKGAVLTQEAVKCNAMMGVHAHNMKSTDHILNVLPLFHIGGIAIQPMPGFLIGATLTIHEKFDPVVVVDALNNSTVSQIVVVPTVLQAMMATNEWESADLSNLTCFAIGSTDVPVTLIEAVHERNVPLIQIYGATETGPIAIYNRPDFAFNTVGSIGRAGLHCEISLRDPEGQEVPAGENGEIWVRGKNILSQYWNNEAATESAIVDGWFRTGDVAAIDDNGDYWFADRIKHVIISGGENIYPAEIERAVRTIEGIGEIAVAGKPDPKWGEVPVVVLGSGNDSVTDNDVMQASTLSLARYKLPKQIIRVEALPRNAMGKVLVDKVRDLMDGDQIG